MADDYDVGKSAKFNAGVAMAERIDALQRSLNAARFNPLIQNFEVGKYNFEIMVSSNDSLLSECWAKLTPNEQKLGDRIQTCVHSFMKTNPVIMQVKEGIKINLINFEKLCELLKIYEQTIKVFLDSHDLNNPNYDDDDEGY